MSIGSQEKPNISHYLGIDFGQAKVGLALADEETKIAFVYTTLKNDKNFLENMIKIIEKENVSKIIIGIPSYNNQKEAVYEGKKLGELIKKVLPEIEIEYQNEMFSTKMAQANLLEKGMKNVGKFDDSESAKIILQSWLDKA
ncbi:MAG: Holliday junction resolvase RuvX [Candidatus Moranbacteria bacterium CG23_combo_of_CG06-09_8_20_14_all_35_22]|nr:MAG: Holliday junction resolvase RuvX [Candidatus Moranbacteria bacterium CG23_combo_of_CG06-09_8_20_14_all_35_22]